MAFSNALLLVEPDPSRRAVLGESLRQNGCQVVVADGSHSASRYLRLHCFDAVVLSLDLPQDDAWTCLREIQSDAHRKKVVAVCGRGDPSRVVRAIREGVLDVLEYPCSAGAVLRVLRESAPKEMPAAIEACEILGTSPAAKLLREQVKRLAATDSVAMLFQGEEGTGRSFLARSVHRHGPRRRLPLRAVDCASLSRGLLEAEIFGRTASVGSGLSDLPEGSVLLIQNVEELPIPLQGRLLAALRAASLSTQVGPHLFATASLALTKAVMEGQFRKDLFFALSGLNVVLPPLRERSEDILLLARAFVEGLAESLCRPALQLSPEAESRLLNHSWPRNIQELKSACEYAVVSNESERIEAADLFLGWPTTHEPHADAEEGVRILANDWSLRSMERALIDRVLERCQHNITQAARDLGINRSTLYNKMKEYHLGRLQSDMKEGA